MPSFPVTQNVQRLLASVRKLEGGMLAAGLPRVLARLPVRWLCWYYCRMLDQKITRMDQVAGKFQQWLEVLHRVADDGVGRLEMLDLDRSMRRDIELTHSTLGALRSYCIDVAQMFAGLGYSSATLLERQHAFLQLLDDACTLAQRLLGAIDEHDDRALALLRAAP